MKIEKNKIVSLIYELRYDDNAGEVIETVNIDNPLTFMFGSGQLLPDFEANLQGLVVDNTFEFQLTSDQAYGPVDDNAIVDIPVSIFHVDGKLREDLVQVGKVIPMQDTSGRRLDGKVVELSGETVKMDFNHPLAGEGLHFSGKVTAVREATEEEISHGHVHAHGHSHSSCSSCGTGDDCNGSC